MSQYSEKSIRNIYCTLFGNTLEVQQKGNVFYNLLFYQIGLIDLKQTKKRERFGVVSDFRYFWLKVFASWQFVFRNT